jgi:RNA polymerase sigma factor (sigma-70 family)
MNFFTRPIKPNDAGDEQLLNSYRQSGDLVTLGLLFERHVPLVYGVCLKYLRDEEESKDAVMGIFEELAVKVKKYEIKQFRSWLYVLSRNYCLMQLRSEKKMDVISLDDIMELPVFLNPDNDKHEDAMIALERCIDKLPPAQKQSIGLFYLKEQCYKEIAGATGFSLNEVKSYIQNGKRNLKICLEKNSE